MPDATEVKFFFCLITKILFKMVKVDVAKRLKLNKRRKRLPIIYHKITANKTYSTINLQMRVPELESLQKMSFSNSHLRWTTR